MTHQRDHIVTGTGARLRRRAKARLLAARKLLPLALSGALIWPAPAAATLLFSGGEDIDFTCATGGACVVTTDSSNFRAGWARLALYVPGNNGDPPLNRLMTPLFTPSPTLWVHAQFCKLYYSCNNGDYATGLNYQMMRVMDTAGNAAIVIRGTGTAGQVAIASRTAAGVYSTLATCPGAFSPKLTQLDLYVNYGTSGEVALYSNSVKVCGFTGDVTNGDGATNINKIEFASPEYNGGIWSEVIIADTDTRAMARFTASTNGNGSATGFSGTNICTAIWNAANVNDANYGYAGASNVTHECTVSNTVPIGSYAVIGLTTSTRALVGASGPQHFNFVVRTGGTDYLSADFAPTYTFTNFQNYIREINPATGLPWTMSDLLAAGFNVGLKTKP